MVGIRSGRSASIRGIDRLRASVYGWRLAANKVIARELGLSDHTVKEYVSSVLAYHGVANRLELVLRLGAERPNG